MRLLRQALISLGGSVISSLALAAPEQQAAVFMDLYSSHCLSYLHDVDGLRARLKTAPQLPAEKATMLMQCAKCGAWVS